MNISSFDYHRVPTNDRIKRTSGRDGCACHGEGPAVEVVVVLGGEYPIPIRTSTIPIYLYKVDLKDQYN